MPTTSRMISRGIRPITSIERSSDARPHWPECPPWRLSAGAAGRSMPSYSADMSYLSLFFRASRRGASCQIVVRRSASQTNPAEWKHADLDLFQHDQLQLGPFLGFE